MAKYIVGIREVHVTTVEVEAPEGTDEVTLREMAKEKQENLDTLDTEYSHTMDELTWSVEGPFND